MTRRKKLLISCCNGWVIRNLLGASVLKEVWPLDDVVFLADSAGAEEIYQSLEVYGLKAEAVAFPVSKLILTVKSFLLYAEVFLKAPRYRKNKFYGRKKMALFWLFKFLHRIHLLTAMRNASARLYEIMLASQARELVLPEYDIFLSAAPNDWRDNVLSKHASIHRKPAANMILSWDNIFAKGYMLPASLYISWGEAMSRQLVEIFGVSEADIFELGAPHIGGIVNDDKPPKDRDALLYSTTTSVHFPLEHELVRQLRTFFLQGKFPSFKKFVIRTHPAGPHEIYNQFHEPDRGVYVMHPTALGERVIQRWIPDTDELRLLGELLHESALALNLASTMSLDCLVRGVKVMNVACSPDGADLMRHYHSEHYEVLIKGEYVKIFEQESALFSAIEKFDTKDQDAKWRDGFEHIVKPTLKSDYIALRARLNALTLDYSENRERFNV